MRLLPPAARAVAGRVEARHAFARGPLGTTLGFDDYFVAVAASVAVAAGFTIASAAFWET